MKICRKCLKEKALESFCKDKSSFDGRASSCKECRAIYRKQYNKKEKANIDNYNKAYHKLNKESLNNKRKADRLKNPEKYKKRFSNWSKNNKHLVNERAARKRARIKQQTPVWANLKAIKDFYKKCPEGYHVDHIIPLKGKNITGLHIRDNLQYLTASANIRKGNSYES